MEYIIIAIVLGWGFNEVTAVDTCEVTQQVNQDGKVTLVTDTYKQEYCDELLLTDKSLTRETKE